MQPDFLRTQHKVLKQNKKIVLFEGCLFLALGLLAIAMPVLFTVGLDLLFGTLFIVGGIAQLYRVVKTWGLPGTWPALFWSLLSLCTGCLMVVRPMVGMLALTTLLVVYFLLEFIAKISFAVRFGVGSQKFWMFLNGVLSLFLALLILAGLPETATWVLGLLVGIDLALFGAMVLALYDTLRN